MPGPSHSLFPFRATARLRRERISAYARDARVPEIGSQQQALRLAQIAGEFVGIDISSVAVTQATSSAEQSRVGNVSFEVMNADAPEFSDASFDLVFGFDVIHHLDIARRFAELARVLRPSGHAVF